MQESYFAVRLPPVQAHAEGQMRKHFCLQPFSDLQVFKRFTGGLDNGGRSSGRFVEIPASSQTWNNLREHVEQAATCRKSPQTKDFCHLGGFKSAPPVASSHHVQTGRVGSLRRHASSATLHRALGRSPQLLHCCCCCWPMTTSGPGATSPSGFRHCQVAWIPQDVPQVTGGKAERTDVFGQVCTPRFALVLRHDACFLPRPCWRV